MTSVIFLTFSKMHINNHKPFIVSKTDLSCGNFFFSLFLSLLLLFSHYIKSLVCFFWQIYSPHKSASRTDQALTWWIQWCLWGTRRSCGTETCFISTGSWSTGWALLPALIQSQTSTTCNQGVLMNLHRWMTHFQRPPSGQTEGWMCYG